MGGVTRRTLLGGAAGALVAGSFLAGRQTGDGSPSAVDEAESFAFYGARQAGIVTPAQDRLHFASFDVTTSSKDALVQLLRDWTVAAAAMTAGAQVGEGVAQNYDSPPDDTGEALGLPASGLTITFGFGPTLFRQDSRDRFGLAAQQPAGLRRLPHFPADNLDPKRSDGDLCIQACANDPQVAVHAIRNLARIGFGTVSMRWAQLGFGRTSSTTKSQETPRNLLGFKDGTANIRSDETDALDRFVWVPKDSEPAWLAGGTYLVARRINMRIETWDRTSLREQEALIGRDRVNGAPLSGGDEFAELDLTMKGRGGPIIPIDAHVRLAHPTVNDGTRILRRGYNFTDGADALGRLDAGLFFIAFINDPEKHYIPMQTRLSRDDALMEYLQHTGSGIWAVPPGAAEGHWIGETLFG